MNPESKFSHRFCDQILIRGHYQRIEASSGSGIPDINYAHNGMECWIETKIADGWKVRLRPYQWAWMQRRIRASGKVSVVAEVGVMIAIFRAEKMRVHSNGMYLQISSSADLLINWDDPLRIDKVHTTLFGSVP